jgi:fructose-1,6-bisphosphatase
MSDLELTMMRRVGELKAEVEQLKKFNDEALAHIAKEERKSRERLEMEQAENARLKAEVERLNRHGDLMLKFAAANMTFPAYATMAKDWNAAKEGKPRA